MGAPQYEQAGADIAGTGTLNTIPRWTGASTLGDSGLIDTGTVIYAAASRSFGVGPNASTASAPLHVFGPLADWSAKINANTTSGSSYGALVRAGTTSADKALQVQNASGSSEYLFVRGDGNVGIGTATPTQKLDTRGAIAVLNSGTDSTYGDSIFFGSSSYPTTYLHKISTSVSATTTSALMKFSLNSGASSFIDVMTLRGDGNVGIGTASPGAKLHSSVADGTYSFAAGGTTKAIRVTHSASETRIEGVDNTLSASFQPLALGGSTLGFNTSGSTRAMTIDASQNVGIGTASPSAKLEIPFTGSLAGMRIQISSANYFNATNHYFRTLGDNNLMQISGTSLDASQPAGYGIKLPATPGNADTQTLDCYAEGTWTPTLTGFGGTNPTLTARYVRVGKLVTLSVLVSPTGGATFSSTATTTYISLPAGMTPTTCSQPGATSNSGIAADGPCVAYTNGNLYLPTFALRAADTFLNVTYML